MKRKQLFIKEEWDGSGALLGLPKECFYHIMDQMEMKEVQSLVDAFVPLLQFCPKKSFHFSHYVLSRWDHLSSLIWQKGEMSVISSLFLLASFVAFVWCDCCQKTLPRYHYESPNKKKHWQFCFDCDKKMLTPFHSEFRWIPYKELRPLFGLGCNNSLDPSTMNNISTRLVVVSGGLRSPTTQFLDHGQLTTKLYLLKDLSPYISV